MNFNVTREQFKLCAQICERFEDMAEGRVEIEPRMARMMDLQACIAQGCPLDLEALLKAEDFDFIHDVAGITRHINRETGYLEDGFSPRFALRVPT